MNPYRTSPTELYMVGSYQGTEPHTVRHNHWSGHLLLKSGSNGDRMTLQQAVDLIQTKQLLSLVPEPVIFQIYVEDVTQLPSTIEFMKKGQMEKQRLEAIKNFLGTLNANDIQFIRQTIGH